MWRELEHRLRLSRPRLWLYVGDGLLLVVRVLAWFYVLLYVCFVFVWMYFVDARALEDVASLCNAFETAFTALQFALSFFLFASAGVSGFLSAHQSSRLSKVSPSPRASPRLGRSLHGQGYVCSPGLATQEAWWTIGLALALFTRSFAELIIVARKNSPSGPIASSTALGREIVTWVFTSMYLIFLALLAGELRQDDTGVDERAVMEDRVRQWIFKRLVEVTDGGRHPPPPFRNLVDDFKAAHDDQEEEHAYANHLGVESDNRLQG